MAVILDTDILTLLLEDSSPESTRIQRRLEQILDFEVFTTIVSIQEQFQGRLAAINHPRDDRHLLVSFQKLLSAWERFVRMNVLLFDANALQCFHDLRRRRIRIGTNDLRIASIALTRNAKVVTRNLRDFEHVPGLVVEDWTV